MNEYKVEEKTPQSFVLYIGNKVYGASFKKHSNTNIYFGKVTKYTEKQWREQRVLNPYERRYTNISLGKVSKNEAKEKLMEWIKEKERKQEATSVTENLI